MRCKFKNNGGIKKHYKIFNLIKRQINDNEKLMGERMECRAYSKKYNAGGINKHWSEYNRTLVKYIDSFQ